MAEAGHLIPTMVPLPIRPYKRKQPIRLPIISPTVVPLPITPYKRKQPILLPNKPSMQCTEDPCIWFNEKWILLKPFLKNKPKEHFTKVLRTLR